MSVKIYLNSDNGLVIEEANGVIYNRTQGDLSAKSENGRIEFSYSASGARFKDYAILDVSNALGVAYGTYAAIISAISDFFVDAALAAAEQLGVDLGIEVQNRTSGDVNLQNQIDTVVSGYLGAIAYNEPAPTPAKSGYYEFSTGGVCAWITGTPTVKVGDRVSVKYTAPSTYVYTHIPVDLTNTDLYNVTVKVPLAAGSYYTAATARAAVPTNIKKLGLEITYATAAGQWANEQFIGSNVSGWAIDGNWVKLGIVEGDINNRVTALENRLGNSLSTNIPDLTSGNTNQWYTLGDNTYYSIPEQTTVSGVLSKLKVNIENTGILRIKVFNISGTIATTLHQYSDINITTTGVIDITIDDDFIIPIGSYISIYLNGVIKYNYYNNTLGIYKCDGTVASVATNLIVGANYTIYNDKINKLLSDVDIISTEVSDLLGTLSTFAKKEEIILKADHGYTTGLLQTLNGISTQGASTGGSAVIQSGHMYARKVVLTSTIPDILFYSTVSTSATFYQLRGNTIINQVTTSVTIGANTIPVNWEAQANDYIGITSTFVFGYQVGGGIGFYDIIISTGSYVLQSGTIPLAFYEKTADGDVIKTLKEVETELLDIIGQNTITPKRKMRKINLSGKKIILYGDSISSTDYTWYASAMSELTSANVYNGGFSGAQTSSLATNGYIQRIYDYNPDLIVCLVGGNDTGAAGSVGTFGAFTNEPTVSQTNIANDYNGTYFIQAVDHIMRKVKAYYYNIRVRAELTGLETEAEKTAKIDALPKPYFVFCTTLAQKRNSSLDSYSQEANWERKRNAVIEACNKNDVHCVDLYNLTGFDMSLEPYWTSPTNKVNNNGIYYMDGLHPNKYGYQVISEIICGDIGIK